MMRKTELTVRFCSAWIMIFAWVSFVGCSKEDTAGPSGAIDVATGTFKGTLRVGTADHYNAVLIVSKVDDKQLKIVAKTGEPYSNVTAKTIQVSTAGTDGVLVHGDDTQGNLTYDIRIKRLKMFTKQTAPTEIVYGFEGEKQ